MIDHFNLPVSNVSKSFEFYTQVLALLGYKPLFQDQDAFGFGQNHWQFGIYPVTGVITPLHIAFRAADRTQVDEFFAVAVQSGAESNGKPGSREQYGPGYYAAYVLDYDGHNIEAVYRSG